MANILPAEVVLQQQDFAQYPSASNGSQDDQSLATMGNQRTDTTRLTQNFANLGQSRSSKETTTGYINTAEEQEDKDAAENKEIKAKNKLKETTDVELPQSVTVLAHHQSAVNININTLNGNVVVTRGHNHSHQHVTVPQPPQPIIVLAHDQTVVNININTLNGNIVNARGHNAGYQHVPVLQPPQSVNLLVHDETVVNINVNALYGDIVGARCPNIAYQHVSVSQHTPGLQHELYHPHDYGLCDSYRPDYSSQ
jgi:hypothetical protein